MKLNDVDIKHPSYKKLWEALEKTLVSRPHEVEAWAALDVKQYFYSFRKATAIENSTCSSTVNIGKGTGKGTMSLLDEAPAPVTVNVELVALQSTKKVMESAEKKLQSCGQEMKKLKSQIGAQKDEGMKVDLDRLTDLIKLIAEFCDTQLDDLALCETIPRDDADKLKEHTAKMKESNVIAEAGESVFV